MYVRLVVIFCSKERVIRPKEAHVDYTKKEFWGIGDAPKQLGHNEVIETTLNECMEILNKKFDQIERMVPSHLKNKDFEIIIHGNYLQGVDWDEKASQWTVPEPIFNIQQLGLPEKDRPLIKTS